MEQEKIKQALFLYFRLLDSFFTPWFVEDPAGFCGAAGELITVD